MDKTLSTSKAEALLKEAEKKYAGGFFKFLTPQAERAKAATKLLHQAAEIYKSADDWENASNASLRCAQIERESGIGGKDLAETYLEVASMQRKFSTEIAIKTMEIAVEVLCKEEKLNQAAKIKEEIAGIYEAEKRYLLAAKNYNEAIRFYNIERESNVEVIQDLLLKVAETKILAEVNKEHIFEAMKIYERILTKYLEKKQIGFFVQDLFFRIALLQLANEDPVSSANSLERFSEMDPDFKTSRQFKFVEDLIKAFEERDVQEFSDLCFDFEKKNPLGDWKTAVLHHAKIYMDPPSFLC